MHNVMIEAASIRGGEVVIHPENGHRAIILRARPDDGGLHVLYWLDGKMYVDTLQAGDWVELEQSEEGWN